MKATKQAAVVEVKQVEVEPAKIILELTEIEAKALGALIGRFSEGEVRNYVYAHNKIAFDIGHLEVPSAFAQHLYNSLKSVVGSKEQ